MMVARFRDLNIPDEPSRHGLSFLGFTTLASGNNAVFGTLHDKPHAIVALNPASPVGYDLYVSYRVQRQPGREQVPESALRGTLDRWRRHVHD